MTNMISESNVKFKYTSIQIHFWIVKEVSPFPTEDSDCQYDLGVKGRDQIYLESFVWLKRDLCFHFLIESVHM